jgi:methionyl-tRNA synthetase
MPHAAGEVLRQLGLSPEVVAGDFDRLTTFGALPFGGQTAVGDVIFPRLAFPVPTVEAAPKAAKAEPKSSVETKPVDQTSPAADAPSSEITIDDFIKVQFRIADITHAEKIEGAKKLLRLEVQLGDEKRQIVSGIADSYTPEELIGMQIVVVYNLKPAKLRGVESQGMLLAATDTDGKAILLQPAKRVVSGAEVR